MIHICSNWWPYSLHPHWPQKRVCAFCRSRTAWWQDLISGPCHRGWNTPHRSVSFGLERNKRAKNRRKPHRPKTGIVHHPTHGLICYCDSAVGHHLQNVAETKGKAVIWPDAMTNDINWESVPAVVTFTYGFPPHLNIGFCSTFLKLTVRF